MVNKKIILGLIIILLSVSQSPSAFGVAKAGAKCTKVGAKEKVSGVEFTCVKTGTKLVWNKSKSATTKENVNQSNARKKAASYLAISAFSRSGLIEQLEFEGFTNSDATYGVDAQNADWNKQAAKKAASYLAISAFSRSGLIEQLEFEGFTQAQAKYGADSTGLK